MTKEGELGSEDQNEQETQVPTWLSRLGDQRKRGLDLEGRQALREGDGSHWYKGQDQGPPEGAP